MHTGTVKWFDAHRRYGFITLGRDEHDVFVHASAVERAGLDRLEQGQTISFELITDRRSGKSSAVHLRGLV